jgi:adenylate cyclase
VLLPVLALLGFAHAGREIAALARQPDWVAEVVRSANALDPDARARLAHIHSMLLWGFIAGVGGVLLARVARLAHARRRGTVRLTYPNGRQVLVPPGLTVLEVSRSAGIPHASVCGGRGRCSTCRVRITRGVESLPMTTREELRVLSRVGAPPNVRLACSSGRRTTSRSCPCSRPRPPLRTAWPGQGISPGRSGRLLCSSPTSDSSRPSPSAGCRMMSCSS